VPWSCDGPVSAPSQCLENFFFLKSQPPPPRFWWSTGLPPDEPIPLKCKKLAPIYLADPLIHRKNTETLSGDPVFPPLPLPSKEWKILSPLHSRSFSFTEWPYHLIFFLFICDRYRGSPLLFLGDSSFLMKKKSSPFSCLLLGLPSSSR